MTAEINATLDAALKAVIAISTATGALAILWGKRSDIKKEAAQRERETEKAHKEEEKAKALVERDNEVARILRERDEKLAAATKAAAEKVEAVRSALELAKEEVASHRKDEAKAFGSLQSKVNYTAEKVDNTHIIVNAQKTAMMQKIADAQLITLTLTQAMLEDKPHNQKLKIAVAKAQALYDQSMHDLKQKEKE